MTVANGELKHISRFQFVGVRLSRGQVALLDACVTLTGQTRTDLIREALSGFLPRLHQRLKGDVANEKMD